MRRGPTRVTGERRVAPVAEGHQWSGGGLGGSLGPGPGGLLGFSGMFLLIAVRVRGRRRNRAHGVEPPTLISDILTTGFQLAGLAAFVNEAQLSAVQQPALDGGMDIGKHAAAITRRGAAAKGGAKAVPGTGPIT